MSAESPLMQMLGSQMRYMSQRQGVLAENIANADTPGFQTKDLKKPDFNAMATHAAGGGSLAMRSTSARHMPGTLSGGTAFAVMSDRDPMEVTPVGNNVTLEDQMAKISETGVEFNMASSLLRKFTGMYRSALGNR